MEASASGIVVIENLISTYSQRLKPVTLQRLSIADILRDGPAFLALQRAIPSREDLRISPQQEKSFNQAIRFINLNEPTGHERDEEHKHGAVRYLGLRMMLNECMAVKAPSIQEACVNKTLQWFETTEAASTSPKKPVQNSPFQLSNNNSSAYDTDEAMRVGDPSARLGHFRKHDLRASHVRRLADLRSRGEETEAMILQDHRPSTAERNHKRNISRQNSKLSEERHHLVASTFHSYLPETDAEVEMNLRWIQQRKEEEEVAKKQQELQARVQKWELDRSRDESEHLRKRESSKLVNKLEKMTHLHDRHEGISKMSIVREKANPSNNHEKGGAEVPPKGSARESPSTFQVMMKSRVPQSTNSKGGMHFRNQLPPNYTPTRSTVMNQLAAQLGKGHSSSASASTLPQAIGIAADQRDGGRSDLHGPKPRDTNYSSDESEIESPSASDTGVERDAPIADTKFEAYYTSRFQQPSQDRVTEATSQANPPGAIPTQHWPTDPEYQHLHLARSIRQTVAIAGVERKTPGSYLWSSSTDQLPRGSAGPTARTQAPPVTRERTRSASRTRPLGTSSTGSSSKSNGVKNKSKPKKGVKSSKTTRPSTSTALPRTSTLSDTWMPREATASMSELRREQLDELEKIRQMFEAKHLPFPSQAFERGLLIPEDRPVLESISNLPLPGSRLVPNPLPLAAKLKTMGLKKKKKKKIKKKGESKNSKKSARS